MTSVQGIASTANNAMHRSPAGFARCGLAVSLAWLSLRLLGVNRTLRGIHRFTRRRGADTIATDAATQLARRVAWIAAFYPGRALCLEQSIALYAVLRSIGYDARFRIGVRPYGFIAHAWVESGGVPIDEHPELLREVVSLPDWPV